MGDLDSHILSTFKEQDDNTKIKLLPLLSARAGEQALRTFRELIDPDKPVLMVAFARTARRVYPEMPLEAQKEVFELAQNPEVRAYMLIGLYRQDPLKYENTIDSWLISEHLPERRAGVLAAGETENSDYIQTLKEMLKSEADASIDGSSAKDAEHPG